MYAPRDSMLRPRDRSKRDCQAATIRLLRMHAPCPPFLRVGISFARTFDDAVYSNRESSAFVEEP